MHKRYPVLLALSLLWSCSNMDYDVTKGIDDEYTLFTEEVSIPLADIGPISPKQLLGDNDLGSTLGDIVKEDEDGYLVVEKEETIYTNPVLLLYISALDPTKPLEVNIDDFTGHPGTVLETPMDVGLVPALQEFSIHVSNPLTEEISVSGKLTLPSSELLFDKKAVASQDNEAVLFHTEIDSQGGLDAFSLQNTTLHLPASLLEKDPLGGWSSIALSYRYKAQLSLDTDFPEKIPIPLNHLNLPIGQYRVKEVLLSTEVSNEIPITLVFDSVEVLVNETDGEGHEEKVVYDNVSITPGLTIASGRSGTPVVSPIAITIKATEGTIPDIAGLQLNLSVKAPAGEGDKRLNMNQSIRFDNVRITVNGGITIQGL